MRPSDCRGTMAPMFGSRSIAVVAASLSLAAAGRLWYSALRPDFSTIATPPLLPFNPIPAVEHGTTVVRAQPALAGDALRVHASRVHLPSAATQARSRSANVTFVPLPSAGNGTLVPTTMRPSAHGGATSVPVPRKSPPGSQPHRPPPTPSPSPTPQPAPSPSPSPPPAPTPPAPTPSPSPSPAPTPPSAAPPPASPPVEAPVATQTPPPPVVVVTPPPVVSPPPPPPPAVTPEPATESRPGNGYGDTNHAHTGPPGHTGHVNP
jgi:hypothetical protein